jgi:RecA-family ATPase
MLDEFEQQVRGDDKHAESGDPRQNRFHFLQAGELLSNPKPIIWLIKNRLEAKSLSMTFGESGSMKSFVEIDKGLCIASGKSWHDHEIKTTGPVFYIAGEGFNGLSRRIRAWEIYYNIPLKDVPFFISDRAAQFLDPDGANDVAEAVDEMRKIHGDPVLVIIDTLNRNFGPGDESTTRDMTAFISVAVRSCLESNFCNAG